MRTNIPLYMYARYGIKTFLPNNDEQLTCGVYISVDDKLAENPCDNVGVAHIYLLIKYEDSTELQANGKKGASVRLQRT